MAEAEVIPIDRDARARTRTGEEKRCGATTKSGRPCRNYALSGDNYCRLHVPKRPPGMQRPRKQAEVTDVPHPSGGSALESFLEAAASFVKTRLSGDYPIDDFGFDEHLFRELLLPIGRPLYNYFRVKTFGVDRIPLEGPAMLVANHSGTIPLDAVMMQHAVATEHPRKRVIRHVGANLVWQMPFLGPLARKSGSAVARDEDALALLERNELLGVFPEGFKGVGKGWSERYRLQRFGRGGFIELALRTKVPIVPVAIVGAEEAYPMIADAKLLAKALGFPYFPITPTFPLLGPLGLIPFPSRWVIEFGSPISMEGYPDDAHEDAMLVFEITDGIRDTIQQMILKNLGKRPSTF